MLMIPGRSMVLELCPAPRGEHQPALHNVGAGGLGLAYPGRRLAGR
jgi:hypothetical protein